MVVCGEGLDWICEEGLERERERERREIQEMVEKGCGWIESS